MNRQLFGGRIFFFFARACAYIESSAMALILVLISICFSTFSHAASNFQTSIQNLQKKEIGIRLDAIRDLGRSHNEQAVAPLAAAYQNEKSLVIRRAVVDSLGLLRFQSAQPTLAQALKDPEPQVRQSAVVALEAVGGKDADDALMNQASTESNTAVKSNLIQTYGRSRNPKASKRLNELSKDSDPTVKRLAQHELDKKGPTTTK